jgi:beta-N-acetylhexosaminidase
VEALTPEAVELTRIVSGMSLEAKVAQLFITTPEGLGGAAAKTEAAGALSSAFAELPVGGFIFAGPNIQEREQFAKLVEDCGHIGRDLPFCPTPFLGVDEEGGPLVARIANSGAFEDVQHVSSMAQVGETADPAKAAEVGKIIGGYLSELGLTVDFAPVADVLTNPDNQVIGSRAFSSDPELTAKMVVAEAEALLAQDVLPCVKHFPGHGGTTTDSHTTTATSDRTLDELRNCEFIPFAAAIEAGVPLIMTAHLQMPAITGNDLPATLSPRLIDGCLRDELGFEGVVVSDSFGMAALSGVYSQGEAAVKFLQAGGDMILMPSDLKAAYQGILDAVAKGIVSEERIDQSVRRILATKQTAGIL